MEHFDVVIVGAGLSGVGAACHLRRQCPDRTVVLLEGRDSIGGTWDLFRYPGVRSDSDMFTFGYGFRPWTEPESIAEGAAILRYIKETAREYGVDGAIRLNHRVLGAHWDSGRARWSVRVARGGDVVTITCAFLYICAGFYRYDNGYRPDFAGAERFAGPVIHPQHWPEDVEYGGKHVIVVGSGATAVTLVPALAETASHVTMLQRSPSYIMPVPATDPLANLLRRLLPHGIAHRIVRRKNALLGLAIFQFSRRRPDLVRRLLHRIAGRRLPAGFDLDTHLSPSYLPWDQRLCLIPDGDLFQTIRDGKASIVTGHIETFTEHGIRLRDGVELVADVIVTATGPNLLPLGGIDLSVDGTAVDLASTVVYKGLMLSGVPNLAWTHGYTNAAWTLKADLIAEYVCRLLNHMAAQRYASVTPIPPPTTELEPVITLSSGYIRRGVQSLPKQGPQTPWRLHQHFLRDTRLLRRGPLDDQVHFRAA